MNEKYQEKQIAEQYERKNVQNETECVNLKKLKRKRNK